VASVNFHRPVQPRLSGPILGAHTGAPLQPKHAYLWHLYDLVGADLCVGPDGTPAIGRSLLLQRIRIEPSSDRHENVFDLTY